MTEATRVLARKRSLEREEYLADREQQAIVEREFQVAIEACIDIAELLIRDSTEEMSPTNAEKFDRLERLDGLSEETTA
ncbi:MULTISPECIES: HepT-like ribonuclease domain-containing protein [Haloferacaceae]|uniref:HepT-like ribonuclease domain-containing protein n=1 Tax=Haloferacaceae TaxID=1644056 RepID=UPI00193A8BCF|nr:HepT-like ribonuclease domain-containing protein [Halobellus captivus]